MRRRPRSWRWQRQFYRQVDVGPRPSIWPRLGRWLVFLIVVALVWWFGWSSFWRVSEVTVKGVPANTGDELTAQLKITGQNIFRIDSSSVDEAIAKTPIIESYQLIRQLPRRVVVELREREPVLIWKTAGESWLIDSAGYAYRRLNADESINKPVVVDSANIALHANDKAAPSSFMRVLLLLEEKLPVLYGQSVREYEVGETVFDVDAILTDNRRVRFNTLGDVSTQLTDLERLAKQKPELFSRSQIDLRVDRWAYVK